MALWFWKRTKQPGEDTKGRYAYHDNRQLLLMQAWSSPFAAPICKNLAYMGTPALFQGPQIMVNPAVLVAGYGGIVTGGIVLQPLNDSGSSLT